MKSTFAFHLVAFVPKMKIEGAFHFTWFVLLQENEKNTFTCNFWSKSKMNMESSFHFTCIYKQILSLTVYTTYIVLQYIHTLILLIA